VCAREKSEIVSAPPVSSRVSRVNRVSRVRSPITIFNLYGVATPLTRETCATLSTRGAGVTKILASQFPDSSQVPQRSSPEKLPREQEHSDEDSRGRGGRVDSRDIENYCGAVIEENNSRRRSSLRRDRLISVVRSERRQRRRIKRRKRPLLCSRKSVRLVEQLGGRSGAKTMAVSTFTTALPHTTDFATTCPTTLPGMS